MVRKLVILAIALAVVGGVFWVFNLFSPTPTIDSTQQSSGPGLEVPPFAAEDQQIGEVTAGPVLQSRYTLLDPQTKQLKRVFGFDRLLNPNSRNERWRLQKPYMRMFETGFHCWITADRGNVQVEKIDGAPSPTDAQLFDNVRIHIRSTDSKDPVEATLYMDDLNFSSERSEFATEGPVRLYSAEAELVGKGMLLIYNASRSRIEYLQITKPEYIRVRNLAAISGPSTKTDKALTTDSAKPKEATESATASGSAGTVPGKGVPANARPGVGKTDMAKAPEYYLCSLNQNVVIRYGDRLVVSGMDKVTVSNLEWSGRATKSQPVSNASAGDKPAKETALAEPKPATPAAREPAEPSQQGPVEVAVKNDDAKDVLVTCQGSIVIRPMEAAAGGPMAHVVESEGSPIRIQMTGANKPGSDGRASCGRLWYDIDSDIMDLYATDFQRQTELLAGDSGARLSTEGRIRWDRRNRSAKIMGPGTLWMPRKTGETAAQPARMAFRDQIDLYFAEPLPQQKDEMKLKWATLVGGMEADMPSDPNSRMLADEGVFRFDDANRIRQVDLSGNVRYRSNADQVQSEKAVLELDEKSTLRSAKLDGLVQMVSKNGQVQSNSATVDFGPDSSLSKAVLTGKVQVRSDQGTVSSPQANVSFAKDTQGKTIVQTVHATGGSEMFSAPSGSTNRPSRFYAQEIHYDMATGNAVAQGPVEFTFYTLPSQSSLLPGTDSEAAPMKPDGAAKSADAAKTAAATTSSEPVPVVITAQKQAEFFSKDNKVIFSGSVVGRREREISGIQMNDQFRGQRMVVDLLPDAQGKNPQIKQITIEGGTVALESIRTQEQKTIAHVRLLCVRLIYDGGKQFLQAIGPGEIEVNNANAPIPVVKPGQPTFNGPCYAILNGFDSLNWDLAKGVFAANGKKLGVNLSYWPIDANGQMGQIVRGATAHFEATTVTTADKKTQITRIKASDGVYYEETGRNIFTGDRLEYAAETSIMQVHGTDSEPCFLNGVRVPVIEYNLGTGEIRSQLGASPGAIPEIPVIIPPMNPKN
jgi:lipopolysaccharide export system protein LptA